MVLQIRSSPKKVPLAASCRTCTTAILRLHTASTRPPDPHLAVCHPSLPATLPPSLRYDDLSHYVNERSAWLASLRDVIEEPWQAWELGQLLSSPDVAHGVTGGDIEGYRALDTDTLKEQLKAR